MSFHDKPLSRRQFFKLGGAAAGVAATAGRMTFFTPAAQAAPTLEPTTDGQLYGVCGVCSMGCAYIAHLKEGRITYLTGNPADQTAQSKLCVKGYSGLRLLYDPDRLKFPMKRTNPDKGIGVDPGWVKISWDEALDLTAHKFKEISAAYGPQALMVVARGQTWQKHFAKSLGTPNLVSHNNTCYTSHDVVWGAMVTGKGKSWTVDYENSRYILAFGWDGLGKSKNHWGQSVLAALDNGAKLVVFDPRLSITASKAHEWIPIKPGTDLAALLAMINVIITEDLYDHDFVANYTTGFAELKAAVKDYTPEWAESICEVPAETIARVAREFAVTKPAVVASHKRDAGGPNYRNSWQTAACFVIMDGLIGSLDRPGGHVLDRKPKLPDLPDVWEIPAYSDTIKGPRIDGLEKFPITYKLGKGSFSTLAEGILSQKPYPLKAAFFWKHNILAFPNPPRLVEGCIIEESPLTLYINGREWITLMCTPVNQEELVLGFLLGEGIITKMADIALLDICHRGTVADVWLERSDVQLPTRRVVTSGCVGGATFADKAVVTPSLLYSARTAEPTQLLDLMQQLNQAATLYRQSRGVHTSALSDGERLLVVSEDVGRHNTLDKIRGACLKQGLDPADMILLTTGRISSEMLRKAADMGVPVVVSRTSATGLSLQLAREWNITLVGYVQKRRLRIYADPAHRIRLPQESINLLPLFNQPQPAMCLLPG